MEMRRVEIEEELRIAPDDDKDELLAQYEVELDALENQKKIFEDLEFQQLEVRILMLCIFIMAFNMTLICFWAALGYQCQRHSRFISPLVRKHAVNLTQVDIIEHIVGFLLQLYLHWLAITVILTKMDF